ncbi:MAG: hypothetical protein HRF51_03595 [bacterium]|jgi:hypothetical protein
MFRKGIYDATLCLSFFLVLLGLVLGGCSSSTSDSNDQSALQVTRVTASPTSITVGSTAIVEAEITDGTNPLPNRAVTFSVSPASAGYFTPAIDTTDADGIVATVFTATQSGSVMITAALTTAVYRSVALSVTTQQGSGSGNIDMAVTPTLLLADGQATSQVTITVRDEAFQPAPDSTVVKLVAGEKFVDVDGNGYFSNGVDSVVYDAIPNGRWDPIGIIPSSAVITGGSGQAVVNYTAGTEAVTVYVKATVADNGITGNAEAQLQLTPDASIASISLMGDPIHLAVKSTGGIEAGRLYATGYDANGNPVPEGLQISFVILDGPGGGEHLGAVGYGPYVAVTNNMGVATCPISSGTISGTIRIRAYSDTVLSNATQIMVHAGPPAKIVVGSEVCNAPYWGWLNKRVTITALVSDVYNNPVADSTVVYFTCDEGTIKAHEARTMDEEGLAGSVWISGYDDPAADGIVEVIAETNGGTLADTGYFINSWIPAYIWFVTPFPTSINADGKTSKVFFVEVRDLNMNFVNDQTEIDIESEFINVASGVVQDGCNASTVRSFMTSVILDYDYSVTGGNDNGVGAIDLISANYKGFVNSTVVCSLLTGPAYYSGCILDAPQTVNYGTSAPFSVTIKDRWGNPLGDHTLVASVTGGGTVSSGTQETNMYGEASGFLFNAPTDTTITSVILRVQDIDPRGNITLTKSISLTN